jgi:BirA family transcriptional regulator, biotin operon repressor / biotin---[acetyl-CoA-carboxylase] ligase
MRFGKPLHNYETVLSTQDVARDLLHQGAVAGTVVSAGHQTHGRGRQGRFWFQKPNAHVCMTVIAPPVELSVAWQLSILVGIAVTEGIALVSEARPNVRFPNDIYLEGRKLGGILIETVPTDRKEYVTPLVGIGVNVNITEEEFPENLREHATSLLRATGHEHLVNLVRTAILSRLEVYWQTFEVGGWETLILPRWTALTAPGAYRTFLLNNRPTPCRVVQVEANGTVTLETENGKQYSLHAAQVILGDS